MRRRETALSEHEATVIDDNTPRQRKLGFLARLLHFFNPKKKHKKFRFSPIPTDDGSAKQASGHIAA
jgi:hypothetical protein